MPNTLIHFFTGTGNTAHAVRTIVDGLRKAGQEVTTVQVSQGVNPPDLSSFDRHIVAFPVLSWAAPVMMRQYLKRFPKSQGKQVAILAVNGAVFYKGKMVPGASGQALEEVEHLLRRKRYDVFLSGEASFPDNWTQMTDPGDEKSQKIIITHGEADVRNFTEKCLSGKRELFRCSPFNHSWTYLVAFLFGKMGRRALGTFYIADSSCTGCGLCARQCPSHTIVMEHNRPRWKTNCQDCNRCINLCPEKAIQTSMPLFIIQCTLNILMIVFGIKAVSTYAPLLIPVAPWLMILIKTVLIIAVLYLASWITLVPLYTFFRFLGKIPAVRKFYCLSVTKKFSRYKGPEYVMRKQEEIKIAILLFDNFTALDVVGPYEVLSKIPNSKIYFVAETTGVYQDSKGLQLVADTSFEYLPTADIVLIPGGFGIDALLTNHQVINWITNAHLHSKWTVSVCSGSLLLGAAGLLKDRKATTHWNRKAQLAAYCSDIVDERYVQDGKLLTSAGVSAGIDMALYLLSLIMGEKYAQIVQLGMEYDPQPPFNSGSPRTAPKELVEMVANRRTKGALGCI